MLLIVLTGLGLNAGQITDTEAEVAKKTVQKKLKNV